MHRHSLKLLLLGLTLALGAIVAPFLPGATRVPAPYNSRGAGEAFWLPMNDTGADAWIDEMSPGNQNRKLNMGSADSHSVITSVAGGRALRLSGTTGDTLTLAHGSGSADSAWLTALTAANHDFTLAWWVRVHYVNAMQFPFEVYGRDGTQILYGQTYGGNFTSLGFLAWLPDGSPFSIGYDMASGWDNVWFHLVIARQGSTWRSYRNGTLSGSATPAGGNNAWYASTGANDAFLLGRSLNGLCPCQVDVADFRAYSRALSDAEVAALYNGGAGRATPLPRP